MKKKRKKACPLTHVLHYKSCTLNAKMCPRVDIWLGVKRKQVRRRYSIGTCTLRAGYGSDDRCHTVAILCPYTTGRYPAIPGPHRSGSMGPQSHTLALLYPDFCRTGPMLLTDMGRVWHGVCFSFWSLSTPYSFFCLGMLIGEDEPI